MTNTNHLLQSICFDGFEMAPCQVWRNIRLIPVVKKSVKNDLRLGLRKYEHEACEVDLGDEQAYFSYVPHGVIARWSSDMKGVVPYGCEVEKCGGINNRLSFGQSRRLEHRMVKKEADKQVRFLPLHLAMEGFLGLAFGVPNMVWQEYAHDFITQGLKYRSEHSIEGYAVNHLAEALKVFEIHDNQVGCIVFIDDKPASVFIVPHPADYRLMHHGLIEDFYGIDFIKAGFRDYQSPDFCSGVDDDDVRGFDDLYTLVARAKEGIRKIQKTLLQSVTTRTLQSHKAYNLGPFRLQRFVTELDEEQNNFIGEAIVRKDGSIEYMKTFALSRSQTRRGLLLKALMEHSWDLAAAAVSLDCSKTQLIVRLDNAGFGYFIKPNVLAWAKKAA